MSIKKMLPLLILAFIVPLAIILMLKPGCNQETDSNKKSTDLISQSYNDSSDLSVIKDTQVKIKQSNTNSPIKEIEPSTVLIYNFHVTNRCPSCIAIEEATTKTLNTYFATEVKQGRIKRQVLNVDDNANKFISQKYEAFGSGLFITCVYNGKESTTDLTGEGFKYARNKEEKFIEILKNKITEYLKK